MKKSFYVLLFTFLFSYLFFEQSVGVNVLCYILALNGLLLMRYKASFRRLNTLGLSFSSVLCGVGCFINGSDLALFGAIVLLISLVGQLNGVRFYLYAWLTGAYSILLSFIFSFKKKSKTSRRNPLQILSVVVPVVLVIVFFLLYRDINPLFEQLTEAISFDNISWSWLGVTFIGLSLILAVYDYRTFLKIDNWFAKQPSYIDRLQVKEVKWDETTAFIGLFFTINCMLIAINLMDIKYLYLGEGLPEAITHKQFVHKGVSNLIFSILLGIVILLYFWRGKLNFEGPSKTVKALSFAWIAQNMFMIVSTAIRNQMYVHQALLTYKRLAVFFWLLFVILGLVFVIIKIQKKRTSFYLIQASSLSSLLILTCCTLVNWDSVISVFNLKRAKELVNVKTIDKSYLLSLSEVNIPLLYEISKLEGFEESPEYAYSHRNSKRWLDQRLFTFFKEQQSNGWQSFSLMRSTVDRQLQDLDAKGAFRSLDLSQTAVGDLGPVLLLNSLRELNLSYSSSFSANRMGQLNDLKLTKLVLDNSYIENLDSLSPNVLLTNLSVDGNKLTSLAFISKFPNLDTLYLNDNEVGLTKSLNKPHNLSFLSLSNNPVHDLTGLSNLPRLECLELNNLKDFAGPLPVLQNLKSLEISNSGGLLKGLFQTKTVYPALEVLSLDKSAASHLKFCALDTIGLRFPNLKSLSVQASWLDSLEGLEMYTTLQRLDLSQNSFYSLASLGNNLTLSYLDASSTKLLSLETVKKFKNLSALKLNYCRVLTDFSGLEDLSLIEVLELRATPFIDLERLKDFTQLEELDVSYCFGIDLKKLPILLNVKRFEVSYLAESDIAYLDKLPALEKLVISKCDYRLKSIIEDKFPALEVIYMRGSN